MTKEEIKKLRDFEEKMQKVAYEVMRKWSKVKGLHEYKYDDGFYCFSSSQDGADEKHKEWLESRVRDKNGVILKVGDIVHNRWDYDLVVHRKRKGGEWYGMLVCEKGDSCENIPYALISEEVELIETF